MIELLLCSMVTILPDFLIRRFMQGKKLGTGDHAILCLVRAPVWHNRVPAAHDLPVHADPLFSPLDLERDFILSHRPRSSGGWRARGRSVVKLRDTVKAGQPIFKLDSSEQEAALETARKRLAEVDAAIELAKTQLVVSERPDRGSAKRLPAGRRRARDKDGAHEAQRLFGCATRNREAPEYRQRKGGRRVSRSGQQGSGRGPDLDSLAGTEGQRRATLHQAQVELDKTTVRAGVDGTLEQFTLRKGDVVNPLLRPAGVLIPTDAGRWGLVAGFNQLEAQVMKVGMLAEATAYRSR